MWAENETRTLTADDYLVKRYALFYARKVLGGRKSFRTTLTAVSEAAARVGISLQVKGRVAAVFQHGTILPFRRWKEYLLMPCTFEVRSYPAELPGTLYMLHFIPNCRNYNPEDSFKLRSFLAHLAEIEGVKVPSLFIPIHYWICVLKCRRPVLIARPSKECSHLIADAVNREDNETVEQAIARYIEVLRQAGVPVDASSIIVFRLRLRR